MIADNATNYLYLADTLPEVYPTFYHDFEKVLDTCNINFQLLPQTKDIWAVDYMPVQIEKDKFVQFVYNPDYLRNDIKWSKTISNVDEICNAINILTQKSKLVIDGGNVVRTTGKVIMCDKVFTENPTITKRDLIKQLQNVFQVNQLIFIPTQPNDFTGHADGIVRFYDSDTVLINSYSKADASYQSKLKLSLSDAGLEYIEIPYNPYCNKKYSDANGIYINYLQMKQAIVIPVFGIKEDELVIKQFEQLFKDQTFETIKSNEIASQGGILNCITWNIQV